MMEMLATNCPLLERLCFYYCSLPSTLKATGLLNLTEFIVWQGKYSSIIEIHAPKLLLFDYKGSGSNDHEVIHLSGCDKLKCLRIISLASVWLNSNPGVFSNLESLELGGFVEFRTDFSISSNRLKSLILGHDFTCCPSSLKLDAPNLKDFTYRGRAEGTSFELNFSDLEKATVHLPRGKGNDFQVVDFLAKFNPCEKLEIHTYLCQELVIHPDMRKNASSPLPNVKHLVLMMDKLRPTWSRIKLNTSEIVDSLLWLCPHPHTISLSLNELFEVVELKVLKFKYEEDKKGAKRCSCCNLLPNPCWQHHLEEVRIENCKGANVDLKKYRSRRKPRAELDDKIKEFFENAREGKMITVNIIDLSC